jgi:hypothetical protein
MILDVGVHAVVQLNYAGTYMYRYGIVTEIAQHTITVTLVCMHVIGDHMYPLWRILQNISLLFSRADSTLIHKTFVAKLNLLNATTVVQVATRTQLHF